MKLGTFIIASGEIPAGSDAAKLFPVFSAPGKPVHIQFAQYYGGDSGEFAQLILVPPTTVINGTTGTADIPGTIACTPPEYMGGVFWTEAKPGTLGADNGGRGTSNWQGFIVPANYQVAIQQDTANSAAYHVTLGGFVLEQE
ncbi:MAG TPA: hypothetical protein EYO33_17175 [Phycisphaerales bacterium]|nr:hypothetical protein [Phycisphaerales bacterium]